MIFPGYPDGEQPPLMNPEGSGALRVMAFGESLGTHEEIDRLPFRPHAEAGSVLERALRIASLDRSQFTLTNLVWYKPPNNRLEGMPYEHDAIAACRPWNEKLIEERQPRCLLALGGLPFRELSGMSGYRQGILLTRGFPVESMYGIPVVGTYHPSYLRRGAKEEERETGVRIEGAAGRGMDLLGVLIRDIQLAVAIARSGWRFEDESDVVYQEHATLEDLANFYNDAAAHPDLPVAWDIENRDTVRVDDESEITVDPFSEVYQIQFSLRKKQAIITDWQDSEAFCKLICAILALPNAKLDFNGRKSDRPILTRFLRDKGFQLEIAGARHDLMDMWHHAQPDLPKGLQFVASFYCPEIGPWKQLDTARPHFYGGRDVDAPQRIFERLPGDLRRLNIWTGYDRHIHQLSPVLDRMTIRGVPINDEKRIVFGKLLDEEKLRMETDLQKRVPDSLRPIHPKEGYKRITGAVKEKLYRGSGQSGLMTLESLPARIDVDGETYERREFPVIDQNNGEETRVLRWCQMLSFNPNSSQQMFAYIRHKREEEIAALMARGHARDKAEQRARYKIPRHSKEDRDTTEKRELLRLGKATGDLLFSESVQIREFSKLKGTYVDGWAPDAEGYAHPSFGYAPATGQLSSENPNGQNVPSEKSRGAAISPTIAKLAAEFRGMIQAKSERVLIEFDYKAFHALTLGFCAKDASYMRLARMDIHSFFAAVGLLRLATADKLLALPDQELAEYLASVKAKYPVVRDGQAKPAILGYGLGMRGYTLWEQNQDAFKNRKEAEAVLLALDRTFPITAKWRRTIQLEAHERKFLTLPPWYIRRFWNVFEHKPVKSSYLPRGNERIFVDGRGQYWKVAHGTDAEAAIAMPVQNAAHGHMKENMLEIDSRGWAERFGLCNTVHDALWFHCLRSLADECIALVKHQMERPSTVLVNEVAPEGLWCEVEVTVGETMRGADRSKVKLPKAA